MAFILRNASGANDRFFHITIHVENNYKQIMKTGVIASNYT